MTVPKFVHQPQLSAFNATNDAEFDWYTPVAVILKPASAKDLKKRLQEDSGSRFSPFAQPYHPAGRSWPPIQDPWEFDPWSPYQSREDDDADDRLSQFYNSYDLPDSIQGKLLSLARMGLVAIPREEIGFRSGENSPANQEADGTVFCFAASI